MLTLSLISGQTPELKTAGRKCKCNAGTHDIKANDSYFAIPDRTVKTKSFTPTWKRYCVECFKKIFEKTKKDLEKCSKDLAKCIGT
jgi:hypothetical protein